MSLAYSLASHLATLPTVLILFALLALLVHLKKPWLGAALFGLVVAALLALSLPRTAYEVMRHLETYTPLKLPAASSEGAQAIVVLGGGRYSSAPEYGDADTVDAETLERLRYAAYLQRKTGLPLLVTGGSVHNEEHAEAELMRHALRQDFNVPVTWVEGRAQNTTENALYTRELLRSAGIKRIYLVTHAYHMRRAVQAFELAGLVTIPAPLGYTTLDDGDRQLFGYLPSAHALLIESAALHEVLGYWWVRLNGVAPST
jgi:uncharacterized SAM-binding protein YcdF (DUF218 family)